MESFVSSKKSPQKRSYGSSAQSSRGGQRTGWTHGHAGRAVDGLVDSATSSLHACTVLDNFYVDQPVWMVDLRQKTSVSGVIIITQQYG